MQPVFVSSNFNEAMAAADLLDEQEFDWRFVPDMASPFIGGAVPVIPSFILAVPKEQARKARETLAVQLAGQSQGEKP